MTAGRQGPAAPAGGKPDTASKTDAARDPRSAQAPEDTRANGAQAAPASTLSVFSQPASAVRLAEKPLSPEGAAQQTSFLSIYQGTPTNALSKIGPRAPKEFNLNDRATITQDRLTLFIENYSQLTSGLKNSTVKLLQAGVQQLTARNTYRGETLDSLEHKVDFSLAEYMMLRGLRDRKEARRQIKNDCDVLLSLTFNWEERKQSGIQAFTMIKPVYGASLSRSGVISLYFAPEFAFFLVNAYEMKLPTLYWSLSDRRNPNSSPMLWKISLMKKQNRGKRSEDIISVKTMLDNAPFIPRYEDLEKGQEKVSERIIEPFERDLNALEPILSWEYCGPRGAALPDSHMQRFPYAVFIKSYVKIHWKEYPELDRR